MPVAHEFRHEYHSTVKTNMAENMLVAANLNVDDIIDEEELLFLMEESVT